MEEKTQTLLQGVLQALRELKVPRLKGVNIRSNKVRDWFQETILPGILFVWALLLILALSFAPIVLLIWWLSSC